jgi:hypothetical protein
MCISKATGTVCIDFVVVAAKFRCLLFGAICKGIVYTHSSAALMGVYKFCQLE